MQHNQHDAEVLEQQCITALAQYYGYTSFRLEQKSTILSILRGFDTMCIMPTGGGKSMCYIIPALVLPGTAVVITPLLALMQDQLASLQQRGIRAAAISSTISSTQRQATLDALHSNDDDDDDDDDAVTVKILLTTPESLHAPSVMEALRGLYTRARLSFVAIDECHCISSWGHDFRPAYRRLNCIRRQFPTVPILALTATATQQVQQDVVSSLAFHTNRMNVFQSSFDRPNIRYAVEYVDRQEHSDPTTAAMHIILTHIRATRKAAPTNRACCIVYVHKRTTADALAAFLRTKHIPAAAYHAGLKDGTRGQVLKQWQEGDVEVVAATVAFGMGLDKADVRMVGHLDIPKSIEGLYQESGRAGRDGKPAHSVVVYCHEVASLLRYLANKQQKQQGKRRRQQDPHTTTTTTEEPPPHAAQQLEAVVEYCLKPTCRREQLLQHFGEVFDPGWVCSGCDVCEDGDAVQAKVNAVELTTMQRSTWGSTLRMPDTHHQRKHNTLLYDDDDNPYHMDDNDRDGISEYEEEEGGNVQGDGDPLRDPLSASAAHAAQNARGKGVHAVLHSLGQAEAADARQQAATRPRKLQALVYKGLSIGGGELGGTGGGGTGGGKGFSNSSNNVHAAHQGLPEQVTVKGLEMLQSAIQAMLARAVDHEVPPVYVHAAAAAVERGYRAAVQSVEVYRSKVCQVVRSMREEAASVDQLLPLEARMAMCGTLHEVWGDVQGALADGDEVKVLEGLKTLQAAPVVTVEALAKDGLGKGVRMMSKQQQGEVGDAAGAVLRVWKSKLM